ncbi:MAG: prevent-host-death protein [Bacteroidales bacterium]|jgi:antitoxin YefM|nr:prevent-host-death protein [Bacteroidales bacterium]
MLVVSSGEFRSNQKYYLDKVDNDETIIVQRGKDKSYLITPMQEEVEVSVSDEFLAVVAEARAEYKRGEGIRIDDIDDYLGLK